MTDHEISALEFDEPPRQRARIDLFFRSLAKKLGFAVILSGAGADGAMGVWRWSRNLIPAAALSSLSLCRTPRL